MVVVARSGEPLEKLQADYPAQVRRVTGDLGDLSQEIGPKSVEAALSAWGRVDGLIVNHGVLDPVRRIGEVDPIEWRDAFNVNLFSAVAIV